MLSAEPGGPFRDVAVVIPAYRPDRTLTGIVLELAEAGFRTIVVVDDGSEPSHGPVFDSVAQVAGVRVIRHAVNLGKGAALKSGINLALCDSPALLGVVTVDADGQHKTADVVRVAASLQRHPDSLILGARAFEGRVPLRSRLGNSVTQQVVHLLVGEKLRDTQTGLRAIPARFAASLLGLASNGYDFELDMLVEARRNSVAIVEQQIETVYEPGNKSSHFNPLVDSMKVYFVLVRFCSVSLATALLDNLAFYIAWRHGAGVLGAQVAGRSMAVLFNYLMVRWAVFRARDSHSTAFPRYLALVLASGAASYAGITLLMDATHLPVLWLKIGVESLLFFVNFAVERDWVFTRAHGQAAEASGEPSPLARPLLWAALLVPLVLEMVCFRSGHLLSQPTWEPAGLRRFEHYTVAFTAVALVFAVLRRRYFLPVCIAAILICSTWAVGPMAVGAVVLLVFSATVLGRLVFGETVEARLAFLAGLALWILAISLTARLPIHYPATYLAALALPIAVGYRRSWRLALEWLDCLRPGRSWTVPEYAALAALAFIAGAHWLIVLKPEVSTDGLDMHMAVAAGMAMHHAFTVDFHKFVWALMPMGADWCYGVVWMLGGEYAARLLNFALLVSIGVLLFRAARQFVSAAVATLLTALFMSTPLVQLVTGSMFVENFVAAMTLAGVAALWRFHETRSARYLFLTALLLGASVALKLGALPLVLFALPFLGTAIAKAWRRMGPGAPWLVPLAVLILLAVAAVPYANAWVRSGNPVFPFANERFHSPYIGNDVNDTRFQQPLTWRTPARLTFDTHLYYEGQDGSFGFQYLLLLPLTLACLIPLRSFAGRSAAIIGVGGAIVIAATTPNGRYLYPLLPFLTVGAASALGWLRTGYRSIFAAALAAAVFAGLWNIYFLPSAGWYHRDFYSSPIFSAEGREDYLREHGPVREIVAYLNRRDRTEPVAFADGSEIAGLIAPAYTMEWHDYQFFKQVWACTRPVELYRLLQRLGVRHVVVNMRNTARPASFTALLSACGQTEYFINGCADVTLRPNCESLLAAPVGALGPGVYDEMEPHIIFNGVWTHDSRFPATYRGTITYAQLAGSEARFAMVGTGFRYVYTRAGNRGEADILVDGHLRTTVDLYSPAVQWQAKTTIADLSPGHHDVIIRVAHRKNARASGYFIDLDAIEVF
ncbi:MAG: glycosyltransferase [Bryobacteraceae bacterium]